MELTMELTNGCNEPCNEPLGSLISLMTLSDMSDTGPQHNTTKKAKGEYER